jgi:hypothetical protein
VRVLVACEYSGRVRDAFLAEGHDAMSCDLLPTEVPGPHFQGDVREVLYDGWDLLVGHPECTYLCNSGVRWLSTDPSRWAKLVTAAGFFLELWNAPIEMIALENPVMHGHAKRLIGVEQSQTIQPWQFGHGETKATCLWLKNLPLLRPTDTVPGREARIHRMPPGPNRWKERSRTFQGIATAMAKQWDNPAPITADLFSGASSS